MIIFNKKLDWDKLIKIRLKKNIIFGNLAKLKGQALCGRKL
jgi:hypothetical protein